MLFLPHIKKMKHIGDDPVEILEFSRSDSKKRPISKIVKITFGQKFLQDAEISAQYFVKKNLHDCFKVS